MTSSWDALRLWMRRQEIAELETGHPPALTPAQRDAIAVLVPSASSPAAASGSGGQGFAPAPAQRIGPVVDPEFDREKDWVTKLFHYAQDNGHRDLPTWEFRDRKISPKTPEKFVPVCTVSGLGATFPNGEYGFVDGEAPCFSTKKDAKKYAAMCAMRCINDLISPPPQGPAPRQLTPQPPKPADQEHAEFSNGVRLTQNAW